MNLKTRREHWQGYCYVAPDIRERHGRSAALGYVVGEKLMMFAQTAETDDRFRAELPTFCKKVCQLFSKAEIEEYFETAARHSLVEPDLFKGATTEEAEELRRIVADAKRDRERRSWVKAMLTQSGP